MMAEENISFMPSFAIDTADSREDACLQGLLQGFSTPPRKNPPTDYLPILDQDVEPSSSKRLIVTGSSKPRPHKICYIAAAITTLAAAILLVGLLVGLCPWAVEKGTIVKFTYNRDPHTIEEVISDSNINAVQFHVSSPTYEMWVVDDFNADIRVLKILAGSRNTCYATPLNRTTATDPSEFSSTFNPETLKKTTYAMQYRAANTPIPDISFLSRPSKDICRGVLTFWVYPSCDSPEGITRRQKRWKFSLTVSWWMLSFSISFET